LLPLDSDTRAIYREWRLRGPQRIPLARHASASGLSPMSFYHAQW